MDGQQFRMCARELIDYITQYNEGLRDRFVLPDVSPGYIHELVPEHAPIDGESWEQLLDDIEPIIMKGVSKLFVHQLFSVQFFSGILSKFLFFV